MVVLAMGLVILIAALAIDVSSWYTTRHQAQVTADSAALAAANYMSTTPNAAPATATTQATTYAADNGLTVSPGNVNVNTGNNTVTVTPQTTGPLLFAGITLKSEPPIAARAVAGWKGSDCSSAGSNCAFMYAADDICSGNTGVTDPGGSVLNHGVTVSKKGTGNGPAITGDVISASSITTSVTGNQNWPSVATYPTEDAKGNACSGPDPTKPKPFSSAIQQSVASSYPIDYSMIYSACGTTSTKFGPVPSCVGSFPAYCTVDITTPGTDTLASVTANAIYCDAGSGITTDPSTWNGTINVTAGGAGATEDATYIAGTVEFNTPSNTTIGPASGGKWDSNLLAYAAECNNSNPSPSTCPASQTNPISSPAIYLTSNGNATFSGDFFAPAGVIDDSLGGTPSMTGFLEGWDVAYFANGTVIGEGPPVTPQATFSNDWLAQ